MEYMEALAARRSHYTLNKDIPCTEDALRRLIEETAALTPDAFNMRSARLAVALGQKQDALWDAVYDAFGGKVAREKIDGFRAACGTVLYFIDTAVVAAMQEKFPRYMENFPLWANHANAMLQFNLWTTLRAAGIGANIQHYNPVIDEPVKRLFGLPSEWQLIAQMPFGGIAAPAAEKEGETITRRVRFFD